MTIKSENEIESEERWYEKVKKFFRDYSETIIGISIFVIIMGVFIQIIAWLISTPHEDLARELIKKDYPAVLCLSPNGSFRTYEAKTYTVHRHKENGWNIYWTDKGSADLSAFHLAHCEIK